jgi:hypothetical protein
MKNDGKIRVGKIGSVRSLLGIGILSDVIQAHFLLSRTAPTMTKRCATRRKVETVSELMLLLLYHRGPGAASTLLITSCCYR